MIFKRYSLFVSLLLLHFNYIYAQKAAVKWGITSSTSGDSYFEIKNTRDKGFLLGGSINSSVNYWSQSFNEMGYGYPVVVKTDSAGNTIWKAVLYSPDRNSAVTSIEETREGGCIAAGYFLTRSPGDSSTLLISKLSADGALEWDQKLGGSNADWGRAVIPTNDNGYLVIGSTFSNDMDVTGFHGVGGPGNKLGDIWVIKLDVNGNILWKKCLGGTGDDRGESVVKTPDNGFIIAGYSSSANGDLINNKGGKDGWIIKLDAVGSILWQKNIGGTGDDAFKSIDAAPDGNFVITGYTNSNNNDVSGNHGIWDAWVVKVDENGNLLWSKCIGGSDWDFGMSVKKTFNGDILVGGHTNSVDGDITENNGGSDLFLCMLNSAGNLIWEKTAGTAKNEYLGAVSFISDGNYAVAGWADSIQGYVDYFTDGILVRLGNASTIKGTAFIDTNGNGTKDVGELPFDQLAVQIEKAGQVRSVIPYNGKFSLDVDTGSYTSFTLLNNPYYQATPVSFTSVFESYFQTDSISFAIQPISGIRDLVVNLIPLTPARPGFDARYKIVYNNAGTTIIPSGVVKLLKDSKLTFLSSAPGIQTIDTDTLSWSFSNLAPLDTASIIINFRIAQPPTVIPGSTLGLMATVSPVEGDETPVNDTSRLNHLVTGSYDPNDKTETHGGTITPAEITLGGYLNYVIRFQNTGTDTAFNIIVKDTLSSMLDWGSFQMVSASHTYNLQINEMNKLEWHFNDVNLVDSNMNEVLSHGYLAFRIRPRSTISTNDNIENSASIYFDYNLPIHTNKTSTLVSPLVVLPVKLTRFSAALRNPGYVAIDWMTSSEENSAYFEVQRSDDAVLFEKIGTVRSLNKSYGASYSLRDNSPFNGMNYYRLKSVDKDGVFTYSSIEVIRNNNEVAGVFSLFPNPTTGHLILKLNSEIKGEVNFFITDFSGKIILRQNAGYINPGDFKLELNVNQLLKGNYRITIVADGKLFTQHLIMQ